MAEVVFYLLTCALAGWIAHLVGKNGVGWFILFLMITPIGGVLAAAFVMIFGYGELSTGHGGDDI